MNPDSMGKGTSQKQSELDASLSGLALAIASLNGEVAEIVQRLEPVLINCPESDGEPVVVPSPDFALGKALFQKTVEINDLARRLRSARQKLAI